MGNLLSFRSYATYEVAALLSCVSVTSLGILAFEITLTRILSVIYSYHYSFFVVSLALFGFGLGGILVQPIIVKPTSKNVFSSLALLSLFFSLSVSFLTVSISTTMSPNMLADAIIMFLPFLVAGIFMAAVYRSFATYGNIVYFADLAGASIGSLASLMLLPQHGAINTVFLIGMVSSVGSLLLAVTSKKRMMVVAAVAGLLLLAFSTQHLHTGQVLDVQIAGDQNKELCNFLKDSSLGAKIIDSRWSAFGRTDLVELGISPDTKTIFVDGGAGTLMYQFNGDFSNTSSEVYKLKYSTGYYPYYFADKGSALVIGAGGGVDVLNALAAGVNHITAVEVNPETVNIVRDYSDYNGGIYTKYENVEVFIDEGRSFLKRTPAKYDVIMLNIPITKTAQGTSGYSLAENYLFTTDSFRDYLEHLGDQGFLVIVAHDPLEVYKLTAITLKVLREGGASAGESMRHVVVTGMHHSHFPVFILKKTAFAREQVTEMFAKSDELGFTPAYFPYINLGNLDPILTELGKEKLDLDVLVSHLRDHYGLDMEPPTDDRPFFYKFEKGIPQTLAQLLAASTALCVVISLLFSGAQESRRYSSRKKGLHSFARRFSLFMPLYFSSLGLGFMLIEVSLIQKFILFLGHPASAISVTLFSLLLSSGIGSLCSQRWKERLFRPALRASLIVGIQVISYTVILPLLFGMSLNYESTTRFLISFTLLFPLGFFMGMPFPLGIRLLEKETREHIPWMWSLNGAYSLLGSIVAVASAITFGFNATFLFGGLTYLAIFFFGHRRLERS